MVKHVKGTYTPEYMGRALEPVPAYLVGSLAVYRRPAYMNRSPWTVSHVPTKAHVEKALPPRLLAKATALELVAWAAAWQEACPAFFAMVDAMEPSGDVHWGASEHRALVMDAVAKGRAL